MLLSGMMFIAGGLVSCENPDGGTNTLSVDPSEGLVFKAKDNGDVVLTVTTTAAEWDFEKPDWVTADKKGDKLTVNAADNTGAFRSGKIIISAVDAPSVSIGVAQARGEGSIDPSKVQVSMLDGDGEPEMTFLVGKDDVISRAVYFTIPAATSAAVDLSVIIDEEYVGEYGVLNDMDCELFPASLLTIGNSSKATIAVGSKSSQDVAVKIEFDATLLEHGKNYLIPLWFKADSDNAAATGTRVTYLVKRRVDKEVRNICWMEVNDANPLNLLEYKLESGEMFWDALVMFSSNINYNASEDRVFISHNPNNQALLDEAETYIKPLTDAGIKVYLSILGNHDPAGVNSLSEYGNEQFAIEIAETVDKYGLDGVAFDDEYTKGSGSGKWFVPKAANASARMCYEAKKAMKELNPDRCDVVIFEWGGLYSSSLVSFNGVSPHEYVDIVNANYGSSGRVPSGGTKKQCSFASVELNYGNSMSEGEAKKGKEDGYGWCMWFALNAGYTDSSTGKGYGSSKYNNNLAQMKNAAKGLYGKELIEPTHYYKKGKDGVYDPVRYEY